MKFVTTLQNFKDNIPTVVQSITWNKKYEALGILQSDSKFKKMMLLALKFLDHSYSSLGGTFIELNT